MMMMMMIVMMMTRQGRSKQPVLGTLGYGQQTALFEDDPGIQDDDGQEEEDGDDEGLCKCENQNHSLNRPGNSRSRDC